MKKSFFNIHVILAIIILAIFCVVGYRLMKWNKGVEYEPEEEIVTDSGESDASKEEEPEIEEDTSPDVDFSQPNNDGYTTVVHLGDSVFGNYRGSSGIPGILEANVPDSVIYNCAFGNMSMANKNQTFSDSFYDDAFSAYWISYAIATNVFTLQENTINGVVEKLDYFDEAFETLKGVDFKKVDYITIMYGANDYMQGRVVDDPNNKYNTATFTGALRNAIESIQVAYPHINIIVLSPTYCYFPDGTGARTGCDVKDWGFGTMATYVEAERAVCEEYDITFIDNYTNGAINADTADQYMEDSVHPNAEGRKLIAESVIKYLK